MRTGRQREVSAWVGFFALIVGLGAVKAVLEKAAAAEAQQRPAGVPTFEVDPFWPKELPNKWILGDIAGIHVDSQDHVWIVNRQSSLKDDDKGAAASPPTSECCVPAPPVVEFDAAGKVLQGWGGPGPGYDWPTSEHGIFVDYKGNVWLGAGGKDDAQVVKFTNNGKLLLQIGHKGKGGGSNDTENFGQPQNMYVDPKTNELYVADGSRNRRVIVFDADTGKYKRHWGAYGNKPDDAAPNERTYEGPASQQFNLVHQVTISNDRLLYVADQQNNRIQVFTPEGKFVKEGFIARETRDRKGTGHAVAFSADKQQRFVYEGDGGNNRVRILNRDTLQVLSSFGRHGPYAGQFVQLHGLASDSKGNIYVGEVYGGNRVQKFVAKNR